jgi:hypothetical protein
MSRDGRWQNFHLLAFKHDFHYHGITLNRQLGINIYTPVETIFVLTVYGARALVVTTPALAALLGTR